MFTLVYIKNQFNRPETLMSFLQSNIGQAPLLRIDCVTPYQGKEEDIVCEVCDYLNSIDPNVEVTYCMTQNISSEVNDQGFWIHFIVMQIKIQTR